ncbi:hypothetical protein NIES2104_51450 [Leptolyngbya sp. NIES-2104]|nr:hypothetical protein NIES2104_51450 [Leptolyngbya sp. NIES-2104]
MCKTGYNPIDRSLSISLYSVHLRILIVSGSIKLQNTPLNAQNSSFKKSKEIFNL